MSPRAPQHGDLLATDPLFSPFLSDDFNAAEFASRALAETATTPQAQLDQLQHGIAQLDRQLRHEVLAHQDELMSHSARLGDADAALQRMSLAVRSLQSVAARVRAEVALPHAQVAAKTRQLRNVQRTVDLLRHVIHRLKLVQRLRAQLAADAGGAMELAKAARLLSEVAAADAEADLTGVAAADADADFLLAAGASVRERIDAALRAGLDALSQADVGSALQALHNLGELKSAVAAHVDASAAAVERALGAALDARKLTSGAGGARGGGGGLAGGPAARVQEALWERLGEAVAALRRAGVQAWHLQRVLLKKRDPLTHELFVDVVAAAAGGGEGESEDDDELALPLDRFWCAWPSPFGALS
jgi:hypothetical protein